MEVQKQDVVHTEAVVHNNGIHSDKQAAVDSERMPEAMGRDSSELPKGYFYSPMFIGSYTAIGGHSPSTYIWRREPS